MLQKKRVRLGYFAQLFIGAALLISALTVAQWWLQNRQLVAIEQELTQVAEDVVHCVAQDGEHCSLQIRRFETTAPNDSEPGDADLTRQRKTVVIKKILPKNASDADEDFAPTCVDRVCQEHTLDVETEVESCEKQPAECVAKQLKVVLESDTGAERVVMLNGLAGGVKRIPIRTSRSASIIQATLQKSLLASLVLLGLGLLIAGWAARRITRPIRQLSHGVEELRQGQFGIQVGQSASGEIGELQRAFNRMSRDRAQLEEEKSRWQARQHLVELGELARGLGHTLRNPLNALGLAVDELAGAQTNHTGAHTRAELVDTARSQIRRIDGWLKSFLAIGAGREAQLMHIELSRILSEVELEAVQTFGCAQLEFLKPEQELWVELSVHGLRAALSNLLSNAIEANPENQKVEVSLSLVDASTAQILIRDHGPGLPDDVRQHLFRPHMSTKANGSGMGLYLAKQLVEGGMNGSLVIEDHPQGGTQVRLLLPLVPAPKGD